MRLSLSSETALALVLPILILGCTVPQSASDEEVHIAEEPAATPSLGTVIEVANGGAQIAAAVTAAPPDRRDAASVYGYNGEGGFVLLRQGAGELICLADKPDDDRFQSACYHQSLEPYMARGRELRAEGVTGPDSFTARHAEIDAGTLAMPREAAMVYNLGGPPEMHDLDTGSVEEGLGRRVYATYIAYASEASTGLSTTPPQAGAPWIMRPGTPSSHIMVVLEPTATASEEE